MQEKDSGVKPYKEELDKLAESIDRLNESFFALASKVNELSVTYASISMRLQTIEIIIKKVTKL